MEALKSSSHCRASAISVREKNSSVSRVERCFLRTRKVSGFGLLGSILVQQRKPICLVSRLSPKTQVDLEEVDVQTEGISQSQTVHVKFRLEKECLFGQQFFMVGDDPIFGLWDPESAVPLNWSDQHVWFAELDIPVGKLIQYKFILKDGTGEILWQPGPNRVFQAWETENTIVVSEDWENAEHQVVTELEQNDTRNDNSDVVIVDEEMVFDGYESDKARNEANLSKQPSVEISNEQSKTISLEENDPIVKRVSSTNESFAASSKILGNNGRATKIGLVNYEGEPVLVPGLPPFLNVLTKEDNRNQAEEWESVGDSVEVFEATDLSMPEIQLDELQKTYNDKLEMGTPELESKEKQMATFAKPDEESESGLEKNTDILLNDLQCGYKTLQNFFTKLRF